jgi:hypothetical protein
MEEIFNGKQAKKLFLQGEDRLEYLAQDGKWQMFDHKFHRASMFKHTINGEFIDIT